MTHQCSKCGEIADEWYDDTWLCLSCIVDHDFDGIEEENWEAGQ